MDKNTQKNILIGVGIVGGISLLGLVIWQFGKGKKTTLQLSTKNNTSTASVQAPIKIIPTTNTPTTNVSNVGVITALQTNLNKLGINVGTPDGDAGTMTKAGIRTFMQKYGYSTSFADITDYVTWWEETEKKLYDGYNAVTTDIPNNDLRDWFSTSFNFN